MTIWPSSIHRKHWDKWVHELDTGCKVWIGGTSGSKGRRPSITSGSKKFYVARLVCEELYGPPPHKHEACHKPPCYNPLCVEGGHLYWGTHQQNMMDVPEDIRRRKYL